jgi:DNA-binding CsgD family transcriptional regulator
LFREVAFSANIKLAAWDWDGDDDMLPTRDDLGPGRSETRDLTERQAEVVQLLVNGMRVKQIVRYLGISKRTVDGHLSAARQRARVRTREELIGWAVWTGVAVPGQSAGSRPLCPDRGGRPPMMTPERIALARKFLRDEPVAEVARKIGVGRSTLYEWLRANGD